MPWWMKDKGTIHPAKVGLQTSMSSSMASLSPSQLNAAIMDMLNVNNTGNRCQNACRGKKPFLNLFQKFDFFKVMQQNFQTVSFALHSDWDIYSFYVFWLSFFTIQVQKTLIAFTPSFTTAVLTFKDTNNI